MTPIKLGTKKCLATNYADDNGFPLNYYKSCNAYLVRYSILGVDNRELFSKLWGKPTLIFRICRSHINFWIVEFEGQVYAIGADKTFGSFYEIIGKSCLKIKKEDESKSRRLLIQIRKFLKELES